METFQERGAQGNWRSRGPTSEQGLCVLHSQVKPGLEAKLVRCTTGAIFDVVVDLRPPRAPKLGKPIRVGIIGAGAGRAIVLQLVTPRRDTPCTGGKC